MSTAADVCSRQLSTCGIFAVPCAWRDFWLAMDQILVKMLVESYSPRTWRTQLLHVVPPEHPEPISTISDTRARPTLDWIFLVSALNFSFWSELDEQKRFAIDWRDSWEPSSRPKRWTGYWSLLAALNRGERSHIFPVISLWQPFTFFEWLTHSVFFFLFLFLPHAFMPFLASTHIQAIDDGIPITDPQFYSSEQRCPDSLIREIFKPSSSSKEKIPLLTERIKIIREVGRILCSVRISWIYHGLFSVMLSILSSPPLLPSHRNMMDRSRCFWKGFKPRIVVMVQPLTWSSQWRILSRHFEIKLHCEGDQARIISIMINFLVITPFDHHVVCFWKRAQILVAETWYGDDVVVQCKSGWFILVLSFSWSLGLLFIRPWILWTIQSSLMAWMNWLCLLITG